MTSRPTSTSVRAYARGARIALWLQLVVVAAGLAVSMYLGRQIQDQSARLEDSQAAVSNNIAVLEKVSNAVTQLSGLQPRFPLVIESLTAAIPLLSENEVAQKRTLQRVLAEAYYETEDYGNAIEWIQRVRELPADEDEGELPTMLLAKYLCASQDEDAARRLLTPEFLQVNGARLLAVDGFDEECGEIAAEVRVALADEPPAGSAGSDPEYEIGLVFLHIRSEAHRPAAIRIGQQLCDTENVSVAGIERVGEPRGYPSAGGVRYYYEVQRGDAERIADATSSWMREENWGPVPLQARLLVGIDGLPTDRVEIWFPPSETPLTGGEEPPAADVRFRCAPPGPAAGIG